MFTDHLTTGPKRNRAAAVINCADPKGKELYKKLTVHRISYGLENGHDIWPEHVDQSLSGSQGTLHTPRGDLPFTSPLVGAHNVENILGATGMGLALTISHKKIKAGIESVTMVPGRLESVVNSSGRYVFVDYAHTPDALENVLTALNSLPHERIICIFGCGGDRDRKKRPLMGEIAGRLCDLAVITSDNPRTESPKKIIEEIQAGILESSPHRYSQPDLESGFETSGYVIEPDRKKAITLGIGISRPGDTVLIAGKGHEAYQVIGRETVPFDDRLVAEKVLSVIPDDRENQGRMTGSA
jgi:UDP-N-acetylmuramyl-tripeptide synthetase